MTTESLIAVGVLVLVHLLIGRLRFLAGTPRSAWLSIAGGVSVAYVFVHLLPDLSDAQDVLAKAVGEDLAFLERHVYLLALAGLVIFYGLERAAVTARRRAKVHPGSDSTSTGVFWLHVSSFAAYNALTGYLLYERGVTGTRQSLTLFSIAMALHFVVNDFGAREHYRTLYDRTARWVFSAAIVLGWVLGNTVEISEAARSVLLALLAGGVILNVMKEELPEERESRFWAFALGSSTYAALLLLV